MLKGQGHSSLLQPNFRPERMHTSQWQVFLRQEFKWKTLRYQLIVICLSFVVWPSHCNLSYLLYLLSALELNLENLKYDICLLLVYLSVSSINSFQISRAKSFSRILWEALVLCVVLHITFSFVSNLLTFRLVYTCLRNFTGCIRMICSSHLIWPSLFSFCNTNVHLCICLAVCWLVYALVIARTWYFCSCLLFFAYFWRPKFTPERIIRQFN